MRFVDEYLIDLNATQAAIRAGYSAKNADKIGPELLGKAGVAEAISEAQRTRSERTTIDADWVLTRLAKEVNADLADLFSADGRLKPIREWPAIWRRGLVSGIDVDEIRADGVVIGSVRKLKLSDRLKRIELIGKHVGVQAFREQVGVGNPNGTPIETITPGMTMQEAADLYARMIGRA
jgi:phage terminase small subunit